MAPTIAASSCAGPTPCPPAGVQLYFLQRGVDSQRSAALCARAGAELHTLAPA
jgi:hypothetical protein